MRSKPLLLRTSEWHRWPRSDSWRVQSVVIKRGLNARKKKARLQSSTDLLLQREQLLFLLSLRVFECLPVGVGRFEICLHTPGALLAKNRHSMRALDSHTTGTVQALDAGSDSHELASTEISP